MFDITNAHLIALQILNNLISEFHFSGICKSAHAFKAYHYPTATFFEASSAALLSIQIFGSSKVILKHLFSSLERNFTILSASETKS